MINRVVYLNPDTLATPLGLYSQVSSEPESTLIFVAGQVALGRDRVLVGLGDFAAQAKQAFANVDAALTAAGANWTTVLKLTTYLTRPADCAAFRTVREEIFNTLLPNGGPYPPHTLLVVAALSAPEHLIEIEAIAAAA